MEAEVHRIPTRGLIQVGIPNENGSFTQLGEFKDDHDAEIFERGVKQGILYTCTRIERVVKGWRP